MLRTQKASNRTSSLRTAMRIVAVFIIAAGTLLSATAAGASSGCGEYSYGFEGTRLLNDGISVSAGPYAISLPAGTYNLTMVSHDEHSLDPYQPDQPNEQFVVELNNGYVSPVSNDIPSSDDYITTVHPSQVISSDATAITVRHIGVGGVNSVDVLCVGFTTVDAPSEAVEEAPVEDTSVEEPIAEPSSAQPAIQEPAVEEPAVEEPKIDEPAADVTNDAAKAIVDDSATEAVATEPTALETSEVVEDEPVVEVLEVTQENVEIAGPVAPEPAAVPAEVVAQPAELAITGQGQSLALALIALGFIVLGGSMVAATEQRI